MRVKVISFEKRSRSPFEGAISDYKKQFLRRFSLEEIFLSKGQPEDTVKKIEVIIRGSKNPFVCILDSRGEELTTEGFTNILLDCEKVGRDIIFIIGPREGLCRSLEIEYDLILSLSRLTFSHRIARLLLFEQIYRAFCYTINHPYNR